MTVALWVGDGKESLPGMDGAKEPMAGGEEIVCVGEDIQDDNSCRSVIVVGARRSEELRMGCVYIWDRAIRHQCYILRDNNVHVYRQRQRQSGNDRHWVYANRVRQFRDSLSNVYVPPSIIHV